MKTKNPMVPARTAAIAPSRRGPRLRKLDRRPFTILARLPDQPHGVRYADDSIVWPVNKPLISRQILPTAGRICRAPAGGGGIAQRHAESATRPLRAGRRPSSSLSLIFLG